ncbi:MAG: AAA family ATPase [Acholeplasmatales bacterium]|nr:AAA family ATPase [Acholeplasmatales bacterium]
MKKLTKIKLVNWHIFTSETIDVKDNVLISGTNGSGKSTLIDAIQYLLIGSRRDVRFNIAANSDAKRTLEGYIRAQLGTEGKEELRSGDVLSHVAAEFYDGKSETYSIVGVAISLPKGGTIKENFYILQDVNMSDELFLDGKTPRDFKDMKQVVKLMGKDLVAVDNITDYREKVSKFFGIDSNKYVKMLPKALAFKPLDLQKFFSDFLLDNSVLNVESLRNNVETLKSLEVQIAIDKDKLKSLDEIAELYNRYKDNKNQKITSGIVYDMTLSEQKEVFLKENQEKIASFDTQLDQFKVRKSQIESDIFNATTVLQELEIARKTNDLGATISKYEEDYRKKKEELLISEEIIANLKDDVKEEYNIIKELSNYHNVLAFKEFIKFYDTNTYYSSQELGEMLRLVSTEIEALKGSLAITENTDNETNLKITKELRDLENRRNMAAINKTSYSPQIESMISFMKDSLKDFTGREVQVKPFCELLEVNDEKWRNALEGYLGSQRFDLFIEPELYDEALKIFNNSDFYGTGIVNTKRIREAQDYKTNSLASKLDTNDIYARSYANYLIGNVICVEKLEDLDKYNRSIMPTGLNYSGYTAKKMNPNSYRYPYIGSVANKQAVELFDKEIQNKREQLKANYDSSEHKTRVRSLVKRDKSAELVANKSVINNLDLIKNIKTEYLNIENQLKKLNSGGELEKINNSIIDQKNKIKQLEGDRDLVVGKQGVIASDKERTREHIAELELQVIESEKSLNSLKLESPELIVRAQTQFYAIKVKHSHNYQKIQKEVLEEKNRCESEVIHLDKNLVIKMSRFNSDFKFGGFADIDGINIYLEAASSIRGNELINFEKEAFELRRNTETSFKESFLGQLKESIEDAQAQIESLNLSLAGRVFGRDSYKLVWSPSDDPELKQYYEVIMKQNTLDHDALFTEGLKKKEEIVIQELFAKITSTSPDDSRSIGKFLDYRNYMVYDIEVSDPTFVDPQTNKPYVTLFSKVSRQKSGGETQVPFYIIIASSFQQLLTTNQKVDSGCIVLLDEAFNNMDTSRIQNMLKFYNNLSIQLIISVPPQRVIDISKYVETRVAVYKKQNVGKTNSIIKGKDEENTWV